MLKKKLKIPLLLKKQFSINNNDLLNKFIIRNSIGSGLIYQHSVIRALYLVEVVHYFRKKYKLNDILLILNSRNWSSIIERYSQKICILFVKENNFLLSIKLFILNYLFINTFIHNLIFNLKLFLRNQISIFKTKLGKEKLFIMLGVETSILRIMVLTLIFGC